MNKKIYLPLVAVVVAISAGVFAYDQVNYDSFTGLKYVNVSPLSVENPLLSYSGDKPVNTSYGLYPELSFIEVIERSTVILSGSIKDVKVVEEKITLDGRDTITANSVYTVIVHSVQKGNPSNEITYVVAGGEGENVVTIREGFVFEKRNQVMLMLTEYEFDGETIYTPMTLAGEFKVTNGSSTSGEVHKYGEENTMSLPEFKSIILEVVG